jgi:hypothetical protein
MTSWKRGERSRKNVVTAKARIKIHENYASIVPIIIPELDEVRKYAAKLHAKGEPWQGEAFGWQAEYHPERPEPPLDSKMTFTPADFCIGESGIWFFSLTWEHGKGADPVEFLDDRNILAETIRVA